jgi:hypothetical protein
MFRKDTTASPLAMLFAASLAISLAGCKQSISSPASHTGADVSVAASGGPGNDDLTMYIGDRFSEAEQRMAEMNVDAAPPAPTF